ncbi:alpha/beta hydrolase [Saccharopolyspora sp. SCSIO 74807]|uniref:alpha/beta fold hydrolase n=1 Tax=Saccharopolyspora sp. SCSIO 74807 TaxID=3118084 RepID=UPI0030D46D8D
MIEARYVEAAGTLAFTELAGSGPVVLCLHTAGQSGVQWRHTTAALAAAGYRVVVPDLPGHGRSEPAANGPVRDLAEYARFCLDLLDRLGLADPLVVGCSIGGKIALQIAALSGDVRGVVAMAAEAGRGRVKVSGLERELEDIAAPSRTDRTHLGTLAVVGSGVDPARAELIATMHRREDPAVSNSDLIGWGTHDVRAELGSIRCPVHLVAGEDDLWIKPDAVRAAAGELPDGRFTLLPGVGHYPMEELPDFARTLTGWLAELAEVRA